MTVNATRPCATCGRDFPVPANNPAKRYCTPRCRVADWRHRHPDRAGRHHSPVGRGAGNAVASANAVPRPNAVAPGDTVSRCPHCGRAVAVVALLLPPAVAHVTAPQPIGGQYG